MFFCLQYKQVWKCWEWGVISKGVGLVLKFRKRILGLAVSCCCCCFKVDYICNSSGILLKYLAKIISEVSIGAVSRIVCREIL